MARESLYISEGLKPVLARAGFCAEDVFSRADIIPWRKLKDRENCTWNLPGEDGTILLHVKRLFDSSGGDEAEGYRLLESRGIATVDVGAWGCLADGRSFLITRDLSGYRPADKVIETPGVFDRLLVPTADLVAKLHDSGLHHRDLYLCHIFAKIEDEKVELRLIDAARVRALPVFPRRRWIVKDLAQFWFSTIGLGITQEQRLAWLARYAEVRGIGRVESLRKSIERKSAWIGAHDEKLRRRQPGRNISIPESE